MRKIARISGVGLIMAKTAAGTCSYIFFAMNCIIHLFGTIHPQREVFLDGQIFRKTILRVQQTFHRAKQFHAGKRL